jgi:parvulin-like peptidyl-prolyl isomerase
MQKHLLKQPLLYFFIIGLFLFFLYEFTSTNKPEQDSNTIVVNKDTLLRFLQYRSKSFNEKTFENELDNFTKTELDNTINDYIKEEVLYREALKMNLDKYDYVIKKRLIQKLDFITNDLIDQDITISNSDIENYYNKNKNSFKTEPNVTFTHIYFKDLDSAKTKIELLKQNKINIRFDQATKHGTRFIYNTNYIDKTPDFIESHFGKDFTKKLFNIKITPNKWVGPIKSKYGYHLVLLTKKTNQTLPNISETKEQIKRKLKYTFSKQLAEVITKQMINQYKVKMDYKVAYE